MPVASASLNSHNAGEAAVGGRWSEVCTRPFAGIADLLRVLEHLKFALNVAFFVRHEYFLHPKSGNLQEVPRETVHIYNTKFAWIKKFAENAKGKQGHLQA